MFLPKHETLNQSCFNAGPSAVNQHWLDISFLLDIYLQFICDVLQAGKKLPQFSSRSQCKYLNCVICPNTIHSQGSETPANTKPNIGLILVHRLRRWPNIKPTLFQRRVCAGKLFLAGLYHFVYKVFFI